jgi:hypothetical protein
MKDDELTDVIAEGQVVGDRTPLGGGRLALAGPEFTVAEVEQEP